MTKLSGDIRIDVPKQRVWEVLAGPEAVQFYSPGLTKVYYTSVASDGVGAARHCEFLAGSSWTPIAYPAIRR